MSEPSLTLTEITIYNLSVRIRTKDYLIYNELKKFLNRYYTVYQNSFNTSDKEVKPYYFFSHEEFFIHINQFKHFLYYLKQIGVGNIVANRIDKRDYQEHTMNYTVRPKWTLRESQIKVQEFLTTNPQGSKLVPLPTGSGKTVVALISAAKVNKKIGLIIIPQFIEKWVSDIVNIHEANTKDIMVVQGSKALQTLIQLAKENQLDSKYFIFSLRTMQEFISSYEKDPQATVEYFDIEPIELFSLLGIGTVIVDETHMQFHALFRVMLFVNVKYHIGLSATLIAENKTLDRVHKIMYTESNIYKDIQLSKYTDVYAVAYSLAPEHIKRIKTKNYGSNNYSHIAFESSVIKYPDILKRYIDIIDKLLNYYYLEDKKPDDKLLIFVSTVKLATILTEYFASKYKHLKVSRYCEQDSYDNIITSDITVTTIISAGTGLDIPNLRVCIQTVSISSTVANIQTLGRLRKLQDRDTKFVYIYCDQIPKQKEYHFKRKEIFFPRAANIVEKRL